MQEFEILNPKFLLALTSAGKHGLRDVDAQDRAASAYPLGQLKRGLSTAAAHIEHVFSEFNAGLPHSCEAEWMDLRVQLLLALDPPRSPLFVPIADLFL